MNNKNHRSVADLIAEMSQVTTKDIERSYQSIANEATTMIGYFMSSQSLDVVASDASLEASNAIYVLGKILHDCALFS